MMEVKKGRKLKFHSLRKGEVADVCDGVVWEVQVLHLAKTGQDSSHVALLVAVVQLLIRQTHILRVGRKYKRNIFVSNTFHNILVMDDAE